MDTVRMMFGVFAIIVVLVLVVSIIGGLLFAIAHRWYVERRERI